MQVCQWAQREQCSWKLEGGQQSPAQLERRGPGGIGPPGLRDASPGPSRGVRSLLAGAESWRCWEVAGSLKASGELAEWSRCEHREAGIHAGPAGGPAQPRRLAQRGTGGCGHKTREAGHRKSGWGHRAPSLQTNRLSWTYPRPGGCLEHGVRVSECHLSSSSTASLWTNRRSAP